MPFAIVNRIIEEFNTNGISSVLRADNILDYQMSSPGTAFGLTNYQKASLAENRILPLEYENTGTVLAYEVDSDNGEWKVAHGANPSNPTAASLLSKYQTEYPDYNFNKITVTTVSEAMEDAKFKIPYTTASKTWRGGNSGWYDELATLGEKVNGFSRSRWANFIAKKASSATVNFANIAKSMIDKYSGTGTVDVDYDKVQDADGSQRQLTHHNDETGLDDPASEHYSGESGLADKLSLVAKFTSYAQTGVNLTCAVVDGLMGVQTLLSTYNRLQKLNLVSGYMEAVQSVQAASNNTGGDPMHEYNNRLVENDSSTGKNAMMSAGMGALFSAEPISASDPSVQSVNVETTIYSPNNSSEASGISSFLAGTLSDVNGILTALTVCNYANATLSFLSAGLTIASFFTGGLTGLISLGWKKIAKAVLFAVIKTLAPTLIKGAILTLGNKLISDMATEWVGEDLGNALVSGGNSLLSSNHQIGGGSPGSPAKVGIFKQSQATVIAEEAEYQRSIRSPFDTSSQYTMLGSMVYSLIPMANSTSVGSTLKNVSSVITNAVSNILPTASAIAETNMVNIAKPCDCPVLDTLDIQGDMYCNPIYITDNSTAGANIRPDEDIVDEELRMGYISKDSNGKITINPKSNLAKYITYCGQRSSSWGVADANIAEDIKTQRGSSSILSWIAPDIDNALSALDDQKNIPWITGSACVASETNDYWRENRIHQRFIEDQRLYADDSGQTTDNPVAAYLNDYYEEHPLDNSYEGILARYSGMTKDDVIATLDLIDGLNYLANYHPEERLAFGETEVRTDLQFEQTDEVLVAQEPKYIIYNTIRNRTMVA